MKIIRIILIQKNLLLSSSVIVVVFYHLRSLPDVFLFSEAVDFRRQDRQTFLFYDSLSLQQPNLFSVTVAFCSLQPKFTFLYSKHVDVNQLVNIFRGMGGYTFLIIPSGYKNRKSISNQTAPFYGMFKSPASFRLCFITISKPFFQIFRDQFSFIYFI